MAVSHAFSRPADLSTVAPVKASGLKDEDQLPCQQAIGRLKRTSRTVRYQVYLVDPESTMTISRQPRFAVSVLVV